MEKRKRLIGYVSTKNIPCLNDDDIRCLDVINLAFGRIHNGMAEWDSMGYIENLIHAKEINPNLKIVLSIGGWGHGGFSEAASTRERRNKFADSAADLVRQYDLDGLDIDWEYPCIGVAGIDASRADKENFTLFLQRLRAGLDTITEKYCTLTIAAGGDSYFTRCTQMDQVHQYLDYVMLMTYDLRGGFSVLTGHHTNLYTTDADLSAVSADQAVQIFTNAGVPKEKLVIGSAFYSRIWKGVPDRDNGYMQMAQSTGGYGPDYGQLMTDYINKQGYIRYWDEEAKAPYLYNKSDFISYEDMESIGHKINYIKEHGLAGMMFWEYSQDTTHTLVRSMAEQLKDV